ncbi:MAG: hypothetical protein JO312_00340, partial [Hyphomicrobiales bacterium]|nr:hypothetical protein [Hyphomicrobiales bacterium]
MAETLLTPSSIKLFGRLVNSLTYTDDTSSAILGCNNFLQHQLACRRYIGFRGSIREVIDGKKTTVLNRIFDIKSDALSMTDFMIGMQIEAENGYLVTDPPTTIADIDIKDHIVTVRPTPLKAGTNIEFRVVVAPKFARIYTFSFEGSIYNLPRPSIFIVHGWGKAVNITGGHRWNPPAHGVGVAAPGGWAGGSGVGRTDLDESGVLAREWEFAAPHAPDNLDLRYWEYEKGDFSIRFDTEAGPFEQILLMAALRSGADAAD